MLPTNPLASRQIAVEWEHDSLGVKGWLWKGPLGFGCGHDAGGGKAVANKYGLLWDYADLFQAHH